MNSPAHNAGVILLSRMWTENQRRAIETRDSDVCVAAGAGSGKTGVLVERFLRIVRDSLEGKLPPERSAGVGEILVITFTEKATKEMKGRIVEELTRAGLREQRREVETAYISTIHGCCSRLLKENPFEAGVDPGFIVLEEAEARQLLRNAFDSVVERAYADNDAEITELIAAAQDERVFGSDLRDPLSALSGAVESVMNRLRGAGRRQEHIRDLWLAGEKSTTSALRKPVYNLLNTLHNELMACRESFITVRAGLMGALEAARRDVVEHIEILAPPDESSSWEQFAAMVTAIKELGPRVSRGLRARSTGSASEQEVVAVFHRVKAALEEARYLHDLLAEREEAADLLCHRFWKLLADTWTAYTERKRARGALDNDDLQSEAVLLLETCPAVLRRYQKRFRYLMVDEFQDTNPLQMRLIELLHGKGRWVIGSLGDRATQSPNDPITQSPNNLFIVGDVQQSIYLFRNADAAIFQTVEREFRQNGAGEHVTMAANFRARPEILRFVNHLFGQIWNRARVPFTPLEAGAKHADKAVPSIEFLLTRDVGRGAYIDVEAGALAARIRQMAEGRELFITDLGHPRCGEPIRYGDVAVLLRSLNDIEKYERAFARLDVPYFVVGGGRGYYARFEVRDIMNVLTVLDTPLDDVALAATLRSPMVGLDTQTLYALARFARREEKYAPLYPKIRAFLAEGGIADEEAEALRRFHEMIEALRREEDRLPVGHLLERILAQTQYDARLLVRDNGRRRLANVRKLLQMANAATTHGVADFIRRLREIEKVSDREGDAPTEEEASDVVRMMSIHRAKGLEFPVVFLADMGRGLLVPERGIFLADPQNLALGCKLGEYRTAAYRTIAKAREQADMEESARLLYVALTRAREHLILCGPTKGRGRGENWADAVFPLAGILDAPAQPEIRIGAGGVEMRLTPMTGFGGFSENGGSLA